MQSPPPTPPPDAHRLGDYWVTDKLGEGGMGAVYLGWDASYTRRVAIKVITGNVDETGRVRFQREASVMARFGDHRNFVQVHTYGTWQGKPYFVMECVDGGDFKELLPSLSLEQRLRIVATVSRALAHAHGHGVVHRDLKPQNILIERDTLRPLISDFGLVRLTDRDTRLTETGSVVGTMHYMAPEQAAGERHRVDQRSDVYAMGTILYECLTGDSPFSSASGMSLLTSILEREPIAPKRMNPDVPEALDRVCRKAMAKEPEDRYQTAAELAEDVERFLAGEEVKAPAASGIVAGVRRLVRRPLTLVIFLITLTILSAGTVALVHQFRQARLDALKGRLETLRDKVETFGEKCREALASPYPDDDRLADLLSEWRKLDESLAELAETELEKRVEEYRGQTAFRALGTDLLLGRARIRIAHGGMKSLKEAREMAERCLDDPGTEAAHAILARIELLDGQPDRAGDHLEKAADVSPHLRARILLALERPEEALSLVEKPETPEGFGLRARLLAAGGATDEALRLLRRASRRTPAPALVVERSRILRSVDRPKDALEVLATGRANWPEHGDLHAERARALLQLGRPLCAVSAAGDALHAEKRPRHRQLEAECLFQSGAPDADILTRLTTLLPPADIPRRVAGAALLLRGDLASSVEKAVDWYDRTAETAPSLAARAARRKRLRASSGGADPSADEAGAQVSGLLGLAPELRPLLLNDDDVPAPVRAKVATQMLRLATRFARRSGQPGPPVLMRLAAEPDTQAHREAARKLLGEKTGSLWAHRLLSRPTSTRAIPHLLVLKRAGKLTADDRRRLAGLLADTGRGQEAIPLLAPLNDPESLRLLARIHEKLGQDEQADERRREAEAREEELEKQRSEGKAAARRGVIAMRKGRKLNDRDPQQAQEQSLLYARAINEFQAAVSAGLRNRRLLKDYAYVCHWAKPPYPGMSAVLKVRLLLTGSGDPDDERDVTDYLRETSRESHASILNLGRRLEKQMADPEDPWKLEARIAYVWYRVQFAYWRNKPLSPAEIQNLIRELDRAIQSRPHGIVLAQRAFLHVIAGCPARAALDLEIARGLAPGHPILDYYAGMIGAFTARSDADRDRALDQILRSMRRGVELAIDEEQDPRPTLWALPDPFVQYVIDVKDSRRSDRTYRKFLQILRDVLSR